nr:hypothetical protein [Salmonella enterica]
MVLALSAIVISGVMFSTIPLSPTTI